MQQKPTTDQYISKLLDPRNLNPFIDPSNRSNNFLHYFKDFADETLQNQNAVFSKLTPHQFISVVHNIYLAGHELPAEICQTYYDIFMKLGLGKDLYHIDMLRAVLSKNEALLNKFKAGIKQEDSSLLRIFQMGSEYSDAMFCLNDLGKRELVVNFDDAIKYTINELHKGKCVVPKSKKYLFTSFLYAPLKKLDENVLLDMCYILGYDLFSIALEHCMNYYLHDEKTREERSVATYNAVLDIFDRLYRKRIPISDAIKPYFSEAICHCDLSEILDPDLLKFVAEILGKDVLKKALETHLLKLVASDDDHSELVIAIVEHAFKSKIPDFKEYYINAIFKLDCNKIDERILGNASKIFNEKEFSDFLKKHLSDLSKSKKYQNVIAIVRKYFEKIAQQGATDPSFLEEIRDCYHKALVGTFSTKGFDIEMERSILGEDRLKLLIEDYYAYYFNLINGIAIEEAVKHLYSTEFDPTAGKRERVVKERIALELKTLLDEKKYDQLIALFSNTDSDTREEFQIPELSTVINLYIDELLTQGNFSRAFDEIDRLVTELTQRSDALKKLLIKEKEYVFSHKEDNSKKTCERLLAFRKHFMALERILFDFATKIEPSIVQTVNKTFNLLYDRWAEQCLEEVSNEEDDFDKIFELVIKDHKQHHTPVENILFQVRIQCLYYHDYEAVNKLLVSVIESKDSDLKADVNRARFLMADLIVLGHIIPKLSPESKFSVETALDVNANIPTDDKEKRDLERQRAIWALEYLLKNDDPDAVRLYEQLASKLNSGKFFSPDPASAAVPASDKKQSTLAPDVYFELSISMLRKHSPDFAHCVYQKLEELKAKDQKQAERIKELEAKEQERADRIKELEAMISGQQQRSLTDNTTTEHNPMRFLSKGP